MERKILAGYDPDHGSADVLELTRVLSDVLGARPSSITAKPWLKSLDTEMPSEAQLERSLRRELEAAEAVLGPLGGEARAIVSPSPALALNEAAEADHAIRAIVLGSSHRGAIGRTLLGTVGESLVHGAPCAIAIAPDGYGEQRKHALQRIAVAYDGSDESRTALEAAIRLAARCHASITVIAVADYLSIGYATTWTVLTAGEITDADHREKRQLLEDADALIPAAIDRELRLLTGDAGHELAAASDDFDLIVAGSRGYGPVRRTLLGSATRSLTRSSACPVLVLPRGAGPDPLSLDAGDGTGAGA